MLHITKGLRFIFGRRASSEFYASMSFQEDGQDDGMVVFVMECPEDSYWVQNTKMCEKDDDDDDEDDEDTKKDEL